MRLSFLIACLVVAACFSRTAETRDDWIDLSLRDKPKPVVAGGWNGIYIIVPDIEDMGRFWVDIGGYVTQEKNQNIWRLIAPGTKDGFIQLVKAPDPDQIPMRPVDSRAWDTGCYWAIMLRAKNIQAVIKDTRKLGWRPLTEMAYVEFGSSKLNVVVLRHMKTGTQVQLYERLTTPLPEGFPDFQRISRPFNIMQMVKDRDTAYDFFQKVLGFETFYYGRPYVSKVPEVMPLGIPKELTTTIPYKAAIVFPQKDMEWGRFEMIEIDGMDNARDFSKQCDAEHAGIYAVEYEVENLDSIRSQLNDRGVLTIPVWSDVQKNRRQMILSSPDGAKIYLREAK